MAIQKSLNSIYIFRRTHTNYEKASSQTDYRNDLFSFLTLLYYEQGQTSKSQHYSHFYVIMLLGMHHRNNGANYQLFV